MGRQWGGAGRQGLLAPSYWLQATVAPLRGLEVRWSRGPEGCPFGITEVVTDDSECRKRPNYV